MDFEFLRMNGDVTFELFKAFVGESTFSRLAVKPLRPRVPYNTYIAHKVSIDGNKAVIYNAGTSGSTSLHKNDGGMVSTPAASSVPEGLTKEEVAACQFVQAVHHIKDQHTAYKEALSADNPEGGVLCYIVKFMLPAPIPGSVLDDVAKEVRKWAKGAYSAR